jgi:hypothetical protein
MDISGFGLERQQLKRFRRQPLSTKDRPFWISIPHPLFFREVRYEGNNPEARNQKRGIYTELQG